MRLFWKKQAKSEHEAIEEQLSTYLDGELTAKEKQAVKQHLTTCRACRWNLQTLRQTVQWTSDLPAVQVPRVFTIPASALPERGRQRRWRLGALPLLQGATALVALLLVFVFAGDFVLGGFQFASAPLPGADREMQAVRVAVTEAVEKEGIGEAGDVALEATAPPTEVVEEQMVAEKAAGEATAAPTEGPQVERMEAVAPPPEEETRGMTATGFMTPAEEAPAGAGAATEVPMTLEAEPTESPAETYDDAEDSAPAEVSTAAPTASVNVAEAPAPAAPVEDIPDDAGALREDVVPWLRAAEVALGLVFILLALATIAVTLRRYRAR